MAVRVGVSHGKSVDGLNWNPGVFYNWKYNVFNLLRDLTKPSHLGVMQIYGGSSLQYVIVEIKIFLICHLTSPEFMFKGLSEFVDEST